MQPVVDPTIRQEGGPVTKVEFTKDYIYETEGPGKGPTFEKGAVYEFPDDLAQRFIRRRVAKPVGKNASVTDKYLVKAAPKKPERDADEGGGASGKSPGGQAAGNPAPSGAGAAGGAAGGAKP